MVRRIRETVKREERWVPTTYEWVVKRQGHFEDVEVEGTLSVIFEGDDVGHLLYVLFTMERGIDGDDGERNVFKGGHLSDRIGRSLGFKRTKRLITSFAERTGVESPFEVL